MRDDAPADRPFLLISAFADQLAERLATRLAPQLAEIVGAITLDPAFHADRNTNSPVAPQHIADDGELWTTRRVAAHYGVTVGFVYQHANELGCIRLGGGQCPRLRFDPRVVQARWSVVGGALPSERRQRQRSKSRRGASSEQRDGDVLLEFDREP